jgi:hypothetical protein
LARRWSWWSFGALAVVVVEGLLLIQTGGPVLVVVVEP